MRTSTLCRSPCLKHFDRVAQLWTETQIVLTAIIHETPVLVSHLPKDRLLNGSPDQTLMHVQRTSQKSALCQFMRYAAKGRSSQICDDVKLGEGAGIRANC
jgi:hypothetical protein